MKYRFYGTIKYSGSVIIEADDEIIAKLMAQRGNFQELDEISPLNHIEFQWDWEEPEKIEEDII